MTTTKDMSELLPTIEDYHPLAILDRFRAAQADRSAKSGERIKHARIQQLGDMLEALARHTKYGDRDYYEMQTIGRVLEYLQEWLKGTHDDSDILMLIRITLMAEVDMKQARAQRDAEVQP